MNQSIIKYIKNGFHIHIVHAFLQYITNNIYLSTTFSIKLYSLNYFYWYGTLYTYLSNPRYNWVKQFIRFTDTGHIASVLPLILPSTLPITHNVHFIIMAGYWLGRLVFGLKDADRIANDNTNELIDWHTDLCTFIHHTIPYILMHTLWFEELKHREIICSIEYSFETLMYTYIWLYTWFCFIYIPWRFYTGDSVYSILDLKETSKPVMFGFIGFIHLLVFLSNFINYFMCYIMMVDYSSIIIGV